ncbi:MAG TPA: tRNA (guanosine(37)-N1)-methyltransferase TrmD [candidate division Zixibacteria bacterium]|nr:tRNA (guanosine(37)-N1)-methyltransferase TrmD [candidate division Zixibacteria bacterium]
MRVDILTLFPEMFSGYFSSSMMDKARALNLLDIHLHDIRDFAQGKHRITDEPPYGGGGGMVLKPEPIFGAVESITGLDRMPAQGKDLTTAQESAISDKSQRQTEVPIILLTPQGRRFSQEVAWELSEEKHLILICGRYEGVDERVREQLATDEISIGDYVLTGGELAAMVVIDAITRLKPGVLGAEGAEEDDSYQDGLLEGPHYTRPESFRGWKTPEILRSGHAAEIQLWRRQQALRRTWQRRPDLLLDADLSEEDKYYLMVLAEESSSEEGNR